MVREGDPLEARDTGLGVPFMLVGDDDLSRRGRRREADDIVLSRGVGRGGKAGEGLGISENVTNVSNRRDVTTSSRLRCDIVPADNIDDLLPPVAEVDKKAEDASGNDAALDAERALLADVEWLVACKLSFEDTEPDAGRPLARTVVSGSDEPDNAGRSSDLLLSNVATEVVDILLVRLRANIMSRSSAVVPTPPAGRVELWRTWLSSADMTRSRWGNGVRFLTYTPEICRMECAG